MPVADVRSVYFNAKYARSDSRLSPPNRFMPYDGVIFYYRGEGGFHERSSVSFMREKK